MLIWTWIEYMQPHRLCYGFAQTGVPWVLISAVVTLISVALSLDIRRFPVTAETVLLLLFCAWMTFTTFFALNSDVAWLEWNRAIKIQLFIFATLLIIDGAYRTRALVWVVVLSIGFYSVKGGIWSLAHGGGGVVYGPDDSFIRDNNDLALAAVTIVPLMRYLQLTETRRWIRIGLGTAIGLSFVSIMGSYSRAAFLAAIVVLVFLVMKSRKKLLLSCVLAGSVSIALAFAPDTWFDRMRSIDNYEEDASALGRLNAWSFAWNLAKDRPVTGGGFKVFARPFFQIYAPVPWDVHEAHSIFLKIMAEHGFPGLLLFLGMAAFTWRSARTIRRLAKDDPKVAWAGDLAAMIQVALAGYAVGGAFSNLAYFDLPYHLMAIVVITKIHVSGFRTVPRTRPASSPAWSAVARASG